MLIASVMHLSRALAQGDSGFAIGTGIFGVIYFGIGIELFSKSRRGLWLGALVPLVGGILGIIKSSTILEDKFLMFHLAAYIVVVLICSILLIIDRKSVV